MGMSSFTVGECFSETVSHGKAGSTAARDDEVVAAAELGGLAFDGSMRSSARQSGERQNEGI